MNPAHSELVVRAMKILECTQTELASSINEIRTDGRRVTQSAISRWININHTPNVEDIICIHQLTGGKVSVYDFYPSLIVVTRKRASLVRVAA